MPNLVVCFKEDPVDEHLVERIHGAWPEVDLVNVGQKDVEDALMSADFFCGHAKVPVDWDSVVAKGRLQWIQSSAAGMDWCLTPSVIHSAIKITTASGVLADQVAEHAMALILAWMRNLPTFGREQHDPQAEGYRKFIRRPTRDLTDLTVGIVGFGGVGRRISEVLAPFRTTILATDLYPTGKPAHVTALWPAERLDDLLAASDVVILCLPLNDQTRGIFDAEMLKKLRPGALFANMARGGLVVTDDLVDALREGRFAGAVVDVTRPEPLPPEHPLWDCPNVIITPHVAGQFYRRFDNVVDLFTVNVRRWKNSQPLVNYLTAEGKRLGFPIRSHDYPLWTDVRNSSQPDGEATEAFVLNTQLASDLEDSLSRHESSTNVFENTVTHVAPGQIGGCSRELREKYHNLLDQQTVYWDEDIHFKQLLGRGGQGVVFLSERRGTDGFVLPLAIKVFSPERFMNDLIYEEEMAYMAMISAKVARIQQDHLLTVHNWRSTNKIRFVEMEWVDGFDLSRLLRQEMLEHLQKHVSPGRLRDINSVVVTHGQTCPRLKPGIAVPIIRDCLGALGALHREGIVHGDIKPSNIMLKRTGNAKVVDIGSAFLVESRPTVRPFTLAYAAPEVLEGKEITPRSDLASLGYVLIEMLSGRRLFTAESEYKGLEGRLLLAGQLHRVLPKGIASSEKLMNFCKSLIAPDPNKRFENGEAADLVTDGAAEFLRQLVKSDLSCEAESEIRNWLEDLEGFK